MGAHIMICPKCNCSNVIVVNETTTKIRNRGCCGWLLWIILAIITVGIILIIPLVTNTKSKTSLRVKAICQNCGHSWYVN